MDSGELETLLSGLTKGTKYVVQVQAVLANGNTSEWSPVEKFTTLETAKLGDVNEDGEVTIADVTLLVNVILGKSEAENTDINVDGFVTIADVTTLVNIILNKQ